MLDVDEAALLREARVATARFLVGCAVFLAALALVSGTFHSELERSGRWFVARFGAGGMTLGAFLADGVHFPLPPQFYLLAGVAAGFSGALALGSVVAGSALGGLLAFAIGRRSANVRFLRERVRGPRVLVERLVARRGYWGLAVAGLLPLSYWGVCSIVGLLRLPYRAYALLAVTRVPRLVVSYAIIVLAWGSSAP